MGVLRSDRVSGLGGANAINGSVFFGRNGTTAVASGNWLTAHSADDFSFGTGDFTIEYWFYFTGVTGSNSGCFQISNTPGGLKNSNTAADGGLALNYENGCVKGIGNNGWFNGTNSVAVETWNHVALVRHSGTLQIFTNGVADTSASDSNNYSLTHLAIGGYYTNAYLMTGYISNFRIQKGKAEYSAAFTPPTTRLERTPETVVLACQSPGNIFQEATGKTLDIRKVTLNDAPPMASRFAPDLGEDHGTTFADGAVLDTLSYMVPPGGTTAQSNRGRGVVLGGGRSGSPTKINTISYLEIPSTGFSNDFGDLTEAVIIAGCCASSTRGVRGGGYATPVNSNVIDYVTIATTSNATNFGDLTQARHWVMGGGSQTRGIFGGGNAGLSPNPNSNVIDYITIASTGNAADFGDLINSYTPTIGSGNAAASPTRLLFAGGSQDVPAPATVQNVIQYVTIASTGDATDFGDLTDNKVRFGVCSSSTRALYGGAGGSDTAKTNSITYVTIATTGNTVDFGDRTVGVNNVAATSNSLRGVFIGGLGSPTSENHIDYVNIATTGNAADWGDSFYVLEHTSACSDSHGGIA